MSTWKDEPRYSEGRLAGLSSEDANGRKPSADKTQSARDTYRVVFWGQCARGHHKAQVAQAFAKRFKVASTRQLAALFSGKVVTLKRGLSAERAERFVIAVEEVGGIARKESEFKDYFSETEFKTRNAVSFMQNDFDADSLSLTPKDETTTEY